MANIVQDLDGSLIDLDTGQRIDPNTGQPIAEEGFGASANPTIRDRQPPEPQRHPAFQAELPVTNVGPQSTFNQGGESPGGANIAALPGQPGLDGFFPGTSDFTADRPDLSRFADLAPSGGGGFSLPDDVISRLADSNIFGSIGVGMRTPGFLNGAAKATQLMAATRQKNRTQDIAQGAVDARSAATASTAKTAKLDRENRLAVQELKNSVKTRPNATPASLMQEILVAREGPNWAETPRGQELFAELKATAPAAKNPMAYLLPDGGGNVLSHDGVTYKHPDTGALTRLPTRALPLGRETGVAQALLERQRTVAATDLGGTPGQAGAGTPAPGAVAPPGGDPSSAADLGTGPYASTKAFIDATVGGIFQLPTMFPEVQKARQQLRLIRQTGIKALMNSARGSTYEQEKISTLFPDPDAFARNPSTESGKIPLMIQDLEQHRKLNDSLIVNGATSAKEVAQLRESNRDIDLTLQRFRELDSPVATRGDAPTPQTQEAFDALPPGTAYIDPDSGEKRWKK